MKKIFSVDVETDGLWGHPIAIAATVVSPDGVETETFAARIPFGEDHSEIRTQWVRENVCEGCLSIEVMSYGKMLVEFAKFYLDNKADALIIAHCPFPVEARTFEILHSEKLIGDWDAPFPLVGIEGLLDLAGEPLAEATAYMEKHSLPLPEGSTHNPLFDCRVATAMYRYLKGW